LQINKIIFISLDVKNIIFLFIFCFWQKERQSIKKKFAAQHHWRSCKLKLQVKEKRILIIYLNFLKNEKNLLLILDLLFYYSFPDYTIRNKFSVYHLLSKLVR